MEESITINNAGLVLCNPFMPRLFSLTGLTEEGKFKDSASQKRAVFLLQHMLGTDLEVSQQELTLNKLMCGVDLNVEVNCLLSMTEQETELEQQMLSSVIQYWGHLGNISVPGLVQSFFLRDGILQQPSGENGWRLKVEQKGYDVLLDSLPWSYSPIKYAWMDTIIYVKWR